MAKTTSLPAIASGEAGLQRYLQDIRKFPMLAPEEELSLSRRWEEQGDEKAAPNSVFINFLSHVAVIPNPPFRGVVTATHTYSEDDHGQPWLLYDDEHDPQQTNNLISWSSRNNPEVVALQKIMHTKLASWMRRLGDTGENGDAINARYMPGSTEGQFPASHYSDKEFDRLKALRND